MGYCIKNCHKFKEIYLILEFSLFSVSEGYAKRRIYLSGENSVEE